MPFLDPPLSVRWKNHREWVLNEPLTYQGSTDLFVVPQGFPTDFASVPRFLQSFVQATGTWTLAAVLHDWLCTEGIATGAVTSRDADGIFRRVLREEGVGPVRRWSMWTAVRWGALFNPKRRPGWFSWPEAPLVVLISLIIVAAVVGVLRLVC